MDHNEVILPKGWILTTIGDIADTTSGGTPLRSHGEYYGGIIPWVKSGELRDRTINEVEETITEIGLKNSSAKIFKKDTIVVALYGATVGKTGILGIDASTNQAVCAIIPRNYSFTPKYMFYWLQSQRQNLINQSIGGAQPNISQGIIRSQLIPLPPFQEQDRIVERIESLFTQLDVGVAGLKRLKDVLKRYKASVLKAASEGRLVLQDSSDNINKGETPSWWHRYKLGDITTLITKGSSPNWQGYDYQETGIVFIRSQNIGWGNLELDSLVYLSPAFNKKENRSIIKTDDVLLNIVGASIGRCAKATSFIDGGNLNQAVAIIRLDKRLATPDFVVNYLLTPDSQHKINLEKVDVARANISLADIRDFNILVPPLVEQRLVIAEVERRLSVVQELEQTIEANLKRAERLRQAILKRSFEGKLV